jgi:hypothetical protein
MLDGFEVADFPTLDTLSSIPESSEGFLYVLCWVRDGAQIPFYVGQTRRLRGRMKDYCLAQFQASTDFRVGEAVRYLRETKKCQIVLRYRASAEPAKDEYHVIRNLQLSGFRLLNDLLGYNYRTAQKIDERAAVQTFCDVLTRSPATEI